LSGGGRVRPGQNHLDNAVNKINEKYGNKDCKAYHDYRELMAREDIDAVMLAVLPDNCMRWCPRRRQNRGRNFMAKSRWRGQSRSNRRCEGGAEAQGNLADGFVAAVAEQFSQGGGNCSQRNDRQGQACGSGVAIRSQ